MVVLNDNFYVTQNRSILVYCTSLYLQLREIHLPEAIPDNHTSLQIAVCQMHNCLYTADSDTQCIYHRMTSWLNEAGSLISLFVATTCSGDVLVLRREPEVNRLRVFNNDGVHMYDISAPNSFYKEEYYIYKEVKIVQ